MRKPVSVRTIFVPSRFSLSRPPLPPSFHPHSWMSDCSLGASWAFSFQSVLPPDYRPRLHLSKGGLGQQTTSQKFRVPLHTLIPPVVRVVCSRSGKDSLAKRLKTHPLLHEFLILVSVYSLPISYFRQR